MELLIEKHKIEFNKKGMQLSFLNFQDNHFVDNIFKIIQ